MKFWDVVGVAEPCDGVHDGWRWWVVMMNGGATAKEWKGELLCASSSEPLYML